eukprot:g379.t1
MLAESEDDEGEKGEGENGQRQLRQPLLTPVTGAVSAKSEHISQWNWNVKVILLYTFVIQVARSIWQAQILSIYLKSLSQDIRTVGYVEGVQGGVRLVTGILTGWLVDNYLKDRKNAALRWMCIYGLCVFAFAAFSVVRIRETYVWYGILSAYSPQRSLQMSIVGTVLADSIKTGRREQVYTVYRVVSNAGSIVGPMIQILYFFYAGDRWSAENLRIVMLIGIGLSASALPLQILIDESRTLGSKSEAKQRQNKSQDDSSDIDSVSVTKSSEESHPRNQTHGTVPPRDDVDEHYARILRWSVVAYDILRVLFGGLVDKYFGVFFQGPLEISPILSALIQMACRIGIVGTTALVGWLSKHISAAYVCMGLLVLVNVANATLAVDPYENSGSSKWILVGAYILRGSALVSVFGLKHALLMDRVPKKHRGKFSALDDLQSGFWSGTAALGGIIIDAEGYRTAFTIMGSGFGLATLAWFGVVFSDTKARRRERDLALSDASEIETDDDAAPETDEDTLTHDPEIGDVGASNNAYDDDEDDDVDDIGKRFSAMMQTTDEIMFTGAFLDPSRDSVHLRKSHSGKRHKRFRRRRGKGIAGGRFRSPSLPAMKLDSAFTVDHMKLDGPYDTPFPRMPSVVVESTDTWSPKGPGAIPRSETN